VLKETIKQALEDQIQAEFHSGYLYLAMAAWCEARNYEGFAHWMRMQAQEELHHAMKLFDYVHTTGGQVVLQDVPAPPSEWESPLAVFQAALEHERYMTGRINELYGLALRENDHATAGMLQWYINEQVEEEATVDAIVGKLEMMGGHGQGLFMLDRELAGRAAPAPPA